MKIFMILNLFVRVYDCSIMSNFEQKKKAGVYFAFFPFITFAFPGKDFLTIHDLKK